MKTDRRSQNAAFYGMVRKHSRSVHSRALRMLGDERDAEEATQDVFLKVFRGLEDYRQEGVMEAWIYRITINVCLSWRRRPLRQELFIEDLDLSDTIARSTEDPEALYLEEESKRELAGLISKLSKKEVEALMLFYYDELPYEKIAGLMGIPTGSVATILHRARSRLHVHILMKGKEEAP